MSPEICGANKQNIAIVQDWDPADYPVDLIEYTDSLFATGDPDLEQDALECLEYYREFGDEARDLLPSKYWDINPCQGELFSVKSLMSEIDRRQQTMVA